MNSYRDRRKYLADLDTESQLVMIYVWIKTNVINKRQYLELVNDVFSRMFTMPTA